MRKLGLFITAAVVSLAGLSAAHADTPGQHPYYLHALTDIRNARWMLTHRAADAVVTGHEDAAITELNGAIADIKAAAIDDGKDINDHTQTEVPDDHSLRLHRALEYLQQAHNDVDREEDDPAARDLKRRILIHIENARRADADALYDLEHKR